MLDRRAFLAGASALPFAARADDNAVDTALILAVDVSSSMAPESQQIQRDGYHDAITDQVVVRAIRSGPLGRIALTFVEWADSHQQRVVVPWTLIDGEATAAAFGAALRGVPPVKWGQTSISAGLLFSASQFALSPYTAARRVIDVSGDGSNNQGAPVAEVRDSLVRSRIVINGLPIITPQEPNIAAHYEAEVIGGPGSFCIPVNSMGEFREGLTRKLIMEIA